MIYKFTPKSSLKKQQQKNKKKKNKENRPHITKTRLYKYIENFTTKKLKVFR